MMCVPEQQRDETILLTADVDSASGSGQADVSSFGESASGRVVWFVSDAVAF